MHVIIKKDPSALFIVAEGSKSQKGNAVQDGLLVQPLPAGFTTGEHGSNEANNDADGSDTSHYKPPDVIANQRWNQAKSQSANNTYHTGGRAKYNTYPQNRHWKDEFFAKFSLI